jgi:hypothetical protein
MRTIARLALTIVAAFIVVWLGIWWYAEARMQSGIADWASRMATQNNVKVTYDGIVRGRSPLVATVSLSNVQLTIQPDPDKAPVVVDLPGFGLSISPANLMKLNFLLPGQINVSAPRGDFAVSFGAIAAFAKLDLHAVLNNQPNPFKSSTVAAQNIGLLASGGSLMILHIDSFHTYGVYNRTAGTQGLAVSGGIALDGLALSPLFTRLASIPFGGKIAHLALAMNATGPMPDFTALSKQLSAVPATDKTGRNKIIVDAVHGWAAQGGQASGHASLAIGPSTLNAAGTIGFDKTVQPDGMASLTADHLDAFTGAITHAYPSLQPTVDAQEARFSPYLTSTPAGGQVLQMNVTYGAGSVTVNGQKGGDLPPVDWTTLANPPAVAPGDGSGAAVTQ